MTSRIPSSTKQSNSNIRHHTYLSLQSQQHNINNLSLQMQLSYIFGTNQQNTSSANTYAYNKDQLIYYNKNMYIKYHIPTKTYRIFYQAQPKQLQNCQKIQQTNFQCYNITNYPNLNIIDKIKQHSNDIDKNCYINHNILLTTKLYQCGINSLFVGLKKIYQFYYLTLFWCDIDGPVYVIKISQDKKEKYTNFYYSHQKGYIYLLYKVRKQGAGGQEQYEKQQHLKIIQIVTPSCCPHCLKSINTIPQPKYTRTTQSNNSSFFNQCSTLKKSYCKLSPKYKKILDIAIKRTGGSIHDIDDLIPTDDCSQLFLYGKDYFRNWKLLINQKKIKQSNYRNIQRNIKKYKVHGVHWINQSYLNRQNNKQFGQNNNRKYNNNIPYLLIITQIQILFIYNNQLIHIIQIPINQNIQIKQNIENNQLLLQKSLNQLYKNKLRVENYVLQDDGERRNQNIEKYNYYSDNINEYSSSHNRENYNNICVISNNNKICVISRLWIQTNTTHHNHTNSNNYNNTNNSSTQYKIIKFCAATSNNTLCIYQILPDMNIKIINVIKQLNNLIIPTSLSNNNNSSLYNISRDNNKGKQLGEEVIKNISVSNDGNLILVTDIFHQNYVSNRSLDSQNCSIQPLYSAGQCHTTPILSLSCPQIVTYLATVSNDGCLKIWNKSQKDRSLLIDAKFKIPPLQAIIHPSGLCIAINFGVQLKIYGIVSNQLQQIVSIKTNDFCRSIQFCKHTNFLITNQKNLIKTYDPFTLHQLSKLQSQDLRLQYRHVKISENGQYIVYQCCNDKIYRHVLANTISHSQLNTKMYKYQQYLKHKQKQNIFCHKQSQEYTCFYFNFGYWKNNTVSALENFNNFELKANNIFIGFTKSKYMVVYSNFGQNLVAQFPIIDGIYITCYTISENILFVGTNRGTVRCYRLPILQCHLQTQVSQKNNEKGEKIGYLKPPKILHQFIIWPDITQITSILKIPNSQQLVAGAIDGAIGFISYKLYINNIQIADTQQNQKQTNESKRMKQNINNIKYTKICQLQKIQKLIQKTQNDIQKIQYQINNQKIRKNKELKQQQIQLKINGQKRRRIYQSQRQQKFKELDKQLKREENQLRNKKNQLESLVKCLQTDYTAKANYQRNRIIGVKKQIQKCKVQHRQRIVQLIDKHKNNIKGIKQYNLDFVRKLQRQFQTIAEQYVKNKNIEDCDQGLQCDQQIQLLHQISLNEQITDYQIQSQKQKVIELQLCIQDKKRQFKKIKQKAQQVKQQDEQKQKIFQQNLQKYNQFRYQNLILHSQLLKIQNQLFQRKQILQKKDQIIKIAFYQKSTNQMYKQFVSGTIFVFQDQKQKGYQSYVRKQQDLKRIFQELTNQISKSENRKLKLVQLKRKLKIVEKQGQENKKNIKLSVEQLKNLKKYLLVQGASQDCQHKKYYQQQFKLLNTIKWLQKRFKMNSINEKKLRNLKKSGVSQVVNQNKNLLQQCNQLREQGKIVQIKIDHLGKRLAEAKKIIQFQQKLKNHKNAITKQNQKLNEIRNIFNDHIELINKQIPVDIEKQ